MICNGSRTKKEKMDNLILSIGECKPSLSFSLSHGDEPGISKSEIRLESSNNSGKIENDELSSDCVISQGMRPLTECDISVDLSCRGLRDFPIKVFSCGRNNVQYLYLQQNLLELLPNSFFKTLPSLRRLDLRENRLRSLPESVGDHQSLEVLLLQDNKLTSLPPQLGWTPRLRGLQLAGNPLEWPPEEVISRGVNTVLSFLRGVTSHPSFLLKSEIGNDGAAGIKKKIVGNLFQNSDTKKVIYNATNDEPQEEWILTADNSVITGKSLNTSERGKDTSAVLSSNQDIVQQPAPIQQSSQSNECKSLISTSHVRKACMNSYEKQHESKPHSLCLKRSDNIQVQEPVQNVEPSHHKRRIRMPIMKKYRSPDNALAFVGGLPFPLGYRKRASDHEALKAYRALINRIWTTQLQCILSAQDTVLQKRKNKEALNTWRKKARQLQAMAPVSDWKGLVTPFDLDSENPTMMSRWELQQFQNKSLEKRGHSKPSVHCARVPGLQEKIVQLLAEVNKVHPLRSAVSVKNGGLEHAAYRKQLSAEMNKIQELHKALQAFHLGL